MPLMLSMFLSFYNGLFNSATVKWPERQFRNYAFHHFYHVQLFYLEHMKQLNIFYILIDCNFSGLYNTKCTFSTV